MSKRAENLPEKAFQSDLILDVTKMVIVFPATYFTLQKGRKTNPPIHLGKHESTTTKTQLL